MQTLYKIKVGHFMLADEFDLMEAERMISRLMPCVRDEIKMIPVHQLQLVSGGKGKPA